MKSIIGFFMGTVGELRRVEWPSRQLVVRHTVYIVIAVLLAAIMVGIIVCVFTVILGAVI